MDSEDYGPPGWYERWRRALRADLPLAVPFCALPWLIALTGLLYHNGLVTLSYCVGLLTCCVAVYRRLMGRGALRGMPWIRSILLLGLSSTVLLTVVTGYGGIPGWPFPRSRALIGLVACVVFVVLYGLAAHAEDSADR